MRRSNKIHRSGGGSKAPSSSFRCLAGVFSARLLPQRSEQSCQPGTATRAATKAPTVYSKRKSGKKSSKAQAPKQKPEDIPLKVEVHEAEREIGITITVPRARCKLVYEECIDLARGQVEIEGYKSNAKAPADLVVAAAGGVQQFNIACAEQLLKTTMEEAVKPHESKIMDGTLRIRHTAEELARRFASTEEDFQYSVMGELGDMGVSFSEPYVGIKVAVHSVLNQEVEDFQVQRALTYTRREKGGDLRVVQRGAQPGDTLIIDYSVTRKEDEKELTGMKRDRHEVDTMDESAWLPGLAQQLMGMRAGETRHLAFTIPGLPLDPTGARPEDRASGDIDTTVKVVLRDVLEWRLPELTLSMVQQVAEDVQSVADFKEKCRDAIISDANAEYQSRIQGAIMTELSRITNIEHIPTAAFQDYAQGKYEHDMHRAMESGFIGRDDVDKFSVEAALEAYVADKRALLEDEFRGLIALDTIFAREGLQVNPEVEHAELQHILERAAEAGAEDDDHAYKHAQDFARNEAMNYAVMAYLQANAEITEVPMSSVDELDSLAFAMSSVQAVS